MIIYKNMNINRILIKEEAFSFMRSEKGEEIFVCWVRMIVFYFV